MQWDISADEFSKKNKDMNSGLHDFYVLQKGDLDLCMMTYAV